MPFHFQFFAKKRMKLFFYRATFFLTSFALLGCGGGSPSSSNITQSTCGFGQPDLINLRLKYPNNLTSGEAINPSATSNLQPISQCPVTQLSSVNVYVCLRDVSLNELSVNLLRPDNNQIQLTLVPTSITAPLCNTNSGSLFSSSVLPSSINLINGNWGMSITDRDTSQNNNGYFVAWSLQLTGY